MLKINTNGGQKKQVAEIRIKGKNRVVPSASIQDRTIVVMNRWPRIASLRDEEFVDRDAFDDPSSFFHALRRSGLGADLFTFVQRFPDIEPKYLFHREWDNVAALPVQSYEDWHNNQLNGNMRKILRRSLRRGVSVEKVDFTDDFVRGVVDIYNETPVRQQRTFWHYGKDFDTVKAEAGTYLDRSIFCGAFFEGKLIGFIKIVFVGEVARLMHILSMAAHVDKLPTNALIAKAVEVCEEYKCSYLTYGKYSYGRVSYTSLTEFKVRNGFKKYLVPRYYVPLTLQGQLALRLGIHQGLKNLVPESLFKVMLNARAKLSRLTPVRKGVNPTLQNSESAEEKTNEESAVAG